MEREEEREERKKIKRNVYKAPFEKLPHYVKVSVKMSIRVVGTPLMASQFSILRERVANFPTAATLRGWENLRVKILPFLTVEKYWEIVCVFRLCCVTSVSRISP